MERPPVPKPSSIFILDDSDDDVQIVSKPAVIKKEPPPVPMDTTGPPVPEPLRIVPIPDPSPPPPAAPAEAEDDDDDDDEVEAPGGAVPDAKSKPKAPRRPAAELLAEREAQFVLAKQKEIELQQEKEQSLLEEHAVLEDAYQAQLEALRVENEERLAKLRLENEERINKASQKHSEKTAKIVLDTEKRFAKRLEASGKAVLRAQERRDKVQAKIDAAQKKREEAAERKRKPVLTEEDRIREEIRKADRAAANAVEAAKKKLAAEVEKARLRRLEEQAELNQPVTFYEERILAPVRAIINQIVIRKDHKDRGRDEEASKIRIDYVGAAEIIAKYAWLAVRSVIIRYIAHHKASLARTKENPYPPGWLPRPLPEDILPDGCYAFTQVFIDDFMETPSVDEALVEVYDSASEVDISAEISSNDAYTDVSQPKATAVWQTFRTAGIGSLFQEMARLVLRQMAEHLDKRELLFSPTPSDSEIYKLLFTIEPKADENGHRLRVLELAKQWGVERQLAVTDVTAMTMEQLADYRRRQKAYTQALRPLDKEISQLAESRTAFLRPRLALAKKMVASWIRTGLKNQEGGLSDLESDAGDVDSSEEAESESFDSVSLHDSEDENDVPLKKAKGETAEQRQARKKAQDAEKIKSIRRRYLKQAVRVERARRALEQFAALPINQPPNEEEMQQARAIIQRMSLRDKSHLLVEVDNRVNEGKLPSSEGYIEIDDDVLARQEIKGIRVAKLDREGASELSRMEVERGFAEGSIRRWEKEKQDIRNDRVLVQLLSEAEAEAKKRVSAGLLDEEPDDEDSADVSPLLPPPSVEQVTPPSASGSGPERKRPKDDDSEREKKAQRINAALIEEYGYKQDKHRYSHHHCRTCGNKGATIRADVRNHKKAVYFCGMHCSDAYVTRMICRTQAKHMYM